MRQTVLHNATIFEGKDLEPVKGYLVIKNGMIEKIAEGAALRRGVDLKRGFVLPPFVNAHTHLADSVSKELYLGKSQQEIVGPRGVKFKALTKPLGVITEAMRATLLDMLYTGTLVHCDFREGGIAGVRLARNASHPFIKSFVLGRPGSRSELKGLLNVCDGVGIPSLDYLPAAELASIAKLTRDSDKLFAIHAAETLDAQRNSISTTGRTEISRALDLSPSFLVHATWSTEDDLKSLKRAKVHVVLCPRANSLLGVGAPPIGKLLELGVPFYLGTDNVTVCQPNMFEEVAFTWACLRRLTSEAGKEEALSVLKSATVEALTFFGQEGIIEEGSVATFLVLARKHNLLNLTDVHAGIVNRARADNLRSIYVRGEAVKNF